MKKLATLLIVISGLCSCASPSGEFRIGTYNLWRSDLGKGDYAWEFRKDRLAESIAEIDFDIFGTQEVDTTLQRELPELIRKAGGPEYEWFIFSPYDSLGGVGNKAQGIMYKPERFEILDSHHFWFSETPEVMSSGWDEMKFKRGGFCLTMKDKKTGKEMFVMHAHMPLGQKANRHAADIIVEKAKEYNPDNLPAFFIGDLNTRPDTHSSEYIREFWNDTYLSIDEKNITGPCGTYNGARERDMRAAQRIDYIYYSGNVKAGSYTCFTKKYDGFWPSDHCPIYADITIE